MFDRRAWTTVGALWLACFGLPAESASAQTSANTEFRAGVLEGAVVNPLILAPPGSATTVHFFWTDPDDQAGGFQLSISFASSLTVLADFTVNGTDLDAVGAEFIDANIDNDDVAIDGDGRELTVGILLDAFPPFDNQVAGPATGPFEIGRVSFLAPTTIGDCGAVDFVDGLDGSGGPGLSNIVVVGTQSLQGFTKIGAMICASGTEFVRSDCNDDTQTDISDMVFLLIYLFQVGAIPHCLEACEANFDGTIDLADPLTIGNYLFSGGPPPPAPFPNCGSVTGTLDCDSFDGC